MLTRDLLPVANLPIALFDIRAIFSFKCFPVPQQLRGHYTKLTGTLQLFFPALYAGLCAPPTSNPCRGLR